RGRRILAAKIRRCIRSLPIEIRSHLIHVAPDLRIVGATTSVENANHFPRTLSKLHRVARCGVGEAPLDRATHNNLPLSGLEPTSLDQLHPRVIAGKLP